MDHEKLGGGLGIGMVLKREIAKTEKLQKENDDIWKVSKMMEANYLDAKKENTLLKITIENLKASQSKVCRLPPLKAPSDLL